MKTKFNKTTETQNETEMPIMQNLIPFIRNVLYSQNETKMPIMRDTFCWAVTGTFHGSIIEAETEGEARRIFHKLYNGESIIYIKKRNVSTWAF